MLENKEHKNLQDRIDIPKNYRRKHMYMYMKLRLKKNDSMMIGYVQC